MNFDFTPEQVALREAARDLFARESPPSRLRAVWDAEGARDGGVWKAITAAGIAGLTVPEALGGQGGDLVDLVGVLEEAGRAALPEPLLDTAAIAAPVLARAGDDVRLAAIAAGELTVAAQPHVGGPVLHGDADVLLAPAGDDLRVLERGDVRLTPVTASDRALAVRDLAEPTGGVVVPGARARFEALGAAATAAFLNGVSLRLLEMTLEHAKSRVQFGVPIGSFQAVKHRLADMHLALESSRPAAWYAAYALARDLPDAPLAASVAKAAAAEAHAMINREALQLHGGIGFTWEHDLHLWLKRGLVIAACFGGAAEHRARVAAALFGRSDDA